MGGARTVSPAGFMARQSNVKMASLATPVTSGLTNAAEAICPDDKLKQRVKDDKSLILTGLQLSKIVYTESKAQQEQACPGVTSKLPLKHMHFSSSDTEVKWGVAHGSFGQHKGEGLYAMTFRGTVSSTNWLTNFKLLAHHWKGMVIHKGFFDALEPHKQVLIKELKKIAANHDRILITGHSLGGALATLFSYYVAEAFPKIAVQLITVGAPRVGDLHFADALETKLHLIYRVAARCDPIPTTPDRLWDVSHFTTRWVVHAGPQITVGAQYACVSTKRIADYVTAAAHGVHKYIGRILHYVKGKDLSLCNHGGTISLSTDDFQDELFEFETLPPSQETQN
jgi:hypothetical protein